MRFNTHKIYSFEIFQFREKHHRKRASDFHISSAVSTLKKDTMNGKIQVKNLKNPTERAVGRIFV